MQKIKSLALVAVIGGLVCAALPVTVQAADETNHKLSAAVEVGTLGPGLSLGWRLTEHLGVRGGVNYFSYSKDGKEVSDISYDSKLRLFSAPVGVDFYPWADSSFRITGGILINGNRFTADAPAQVPGALFIDLGGASIDSAAIGDLHMKVDQNTISPYVGVGYTWFFGSEKRWSLGGEAGVAYAGSPNVSLSRNGAANAGIDNQLAIEQQQIEDDLNKYTVYPIVRVSVGFSF